MLYRQLQVLRLGWNNLNPKAGAALAAGLKYCSTLQQLLLPWSGIGDEGASAVAAALEHNSSIKLLDMSGCKASGECWCCTVLPAGAVLYCTVLYCTVLCCTVPYCTVLPAKKTMYSQYKVQNYNLFMTDGRGCDAAVNSYPQGSTARRVCVYVCVCVACIIHLRSAVNYRFALLSASLSCCPCCIAPEWPSIPAKS
jgi:hypothetical protein